MTRIIYYYQTFCGLNKILDLEDNIVTHIHLSSIHFGNNDNGTPYIHLNDYEPNDKIFDSMWKDIKKAKEKGIKIILMLGGAGGAFTDLFNNFETYYQLLYTTIKEHSEITGIDLDIEEQVNLDDVKMLIKRIHDDFGNKFTIAMAPLSYSLKNDEPGMGGFSYKELFTSPEGKYIDYFNGQFYGDFGEKAYDDAVNNGYPANKIVMGMLSGLFNSNNFKQALVEIKNLSNKYEYDFGGVFVWEYNDCPPDKNNKSKWATEINSVLKKTSYTDYCVIS